ncbi:hypothetical protein SBOR_7180 [Sclerotinia borealis F-4128]|uniref:C2H2-type domain-containing protein n=1 Tax=Sclerotinia borealis (strain F-4128) TaxID=1432307 RepID=W9C9A1_SCLBF|nr:hypothetical protein SBOR_7180 [Sclerotinia borealis F-4128]
MAVNHWSKEDIELLASIDFCKQRKVEPKENRLKFMILLRGVSNPDVVKDHLIELWRKYGYQSEDTDQTISSVDMLSKGSAYMVKLPGEMHKAIKTRVDQHVNNETSQFIIKLIEDSEEQKRNTGQSKNDSLTKEDERGVKRGKQLEKADNSLPLSKKPRLSKDDSSATVIQHSAASGSRKSRPPAEKPAVTSAEATDGVATCNGKEIIQAKPQVPPLDPSDQETNGDNWAKHWKSVENKHNREIAHIQELWQAEVEKLSIKEAEAQATIRDLKVQIKHLNEARKTREEGERETHEKDANISLETRQFEDLEEIYRLTKENKEIRKFATFANLDLPGSLHLGHDTADDAMDQIQFELSSISYHRNTSQQLFPKIFAMSGDLRNLILSAFGSDIETASGRNDVETIMKKFDAHICIRVFVLAALKDWVFMSSFPNFAPSNPRILLNYRHIISRIGECHAINIGQRTNLVDGKDRLYSLDMAAHRAIIEGKWFKEESIPRRATDFAARLSNAMAPLFATTSDNIEDGLFHTWGEHPECWKDRRAHLQEIFQTALTLKANSVITKSRYEFVIYPVGTTFVDDITARKHSSGSKSCSSWIHASFHIYDTATGGNIKESALVQTQNFLRKTAEERIGAKYSKVLLFPKKSSEAVSSRITELAENSKPDCRSTGQSSKGVQLGTSQLSTVANTYDSDIKAHNSVETEDFSNSDRSGDPPLPRCEQCDKEFPALASLRTHEKNRSCTKCPECGRRFNRASTLRNHQKAEHSEYCRPKRGEQMTELSAEPIRPQPSAMVDQQNSRYHEDILAAVARTFSPTYQRVETQHKAQLIDTPRPDSITKPQTAPEESHQNIPREKRIETETVDPKPKCSHCERTFVDITKLYRHLKLSELYRAYMCLSLTQVSEVCSLDCLVCNEKFNSLDDRRHHQRAEHSKIRNLMEGEGRVAPEPQTPSVPPEKPNTKSLTPTRTPSTTGARSHDRSRLSHHIALSARWLVTDDSKAGKSRYKKTPSRETEGSDADDMLSPSEMVKVNRAQRRTTRSSNGAEMRNG